MKTLYFVSSGPDKSHMWDVDIFEKLRDAKEFARQLPANPMGNDTPFKIERHQYLSSEIWGDIVRKSEISKQEATK